MKFVFITKDEAVRETAKIAFPNSQDEVLCFDSWALGLDACKGADMVFVDLIATLEEPHKIAGYEKFALAKMSHAGAKEVPLILLAPPADYDLDFMTGWPDFVFAQLRKPVNEKVFRRVVTYI
jgi:hypothetical protein